MNDLDIQDFVTRFAAAWAARDGEAFLALWHPDGVLHSPLYDRPVAGKELGRLTELVRETAPDRQVPAARGTDRRGKGVHGHRGYQGGALARLARAADPVGLTARGEACMLTGRELPLTRDRK